MSCLDHIVKLCMERILDFYIAPIRTDFLLLNTVSQQEVHRRRAELEAQIGEHH